jgi:hypothetical protein
MRLLNRLSLVGVLLTPIPDWVIPTRTASRLREVATFSNASARRKAVKVQSS